MASMKFYCDAERCIECNACVTACKNEHDIPWGVNRRRVVTIKDGEPGERSLSVACMHCADAPCAAVCPVDCFYTTGDGIVLHDKDIVFVLAGGYAGITFDTTFCITIEFHTSHYSIPLSFRNATKTTF